MFWAFMLGIVLGIVLGLMVCAHLINAVVKEYERE